MIASCNRADIRAWSLSLYIPACGGEILNLCWYDLDFALASFSCGTRRNSDSGTCPWMRPLAALFRAYPPDRAQTWSSLAHLAATSWMFGRDSRMPAAGWAY